MQKISASRFIHPYFEDEHGEPDTLPVFALDPDTGYCQPYPHWKASLSRQVAWVPTYIKRFRATIPNDNSDVSQILRDFTDEQIVILLHDEPFKTASAKWSEMRKSPEEVEAMRSQARWYKRTERKAAVRRFYIAEIPSFQGDDLEHLAHSGFMSAEESDSGDVAEAKRICARLGPNARIPTRRVSVIKRPIPQLKPSNDDKAAAIRIAICSLGKSWRDANPDEPQQSSYLINFKVTVMPSIDNFLSEHPMNDELDERHPGFHVVGEGEDGLDVNNEGTAPCNAGNG
ncbi:hypothetical protein FRC11_012067 [Ceratobasidium sp. 423]|nr:hypothetical protein FRC11_012067 [Ceratobasidium sp. 423]